MPTMEVAVEQVLELVRQLPPEGKQAVLDALSTERDMWWEEMLIEGEQKMRQLCAGRGLDWDRMSEEEREAFVGDLLHEDG